jgi:hypothetical protein
MGFDDIGCEFSGIEGVLGDSIGFDDIGCEFSGIRVNSSGFEWMEDRGRDSPLAGSLRSLLGLWPEFAFGKRCALRLLTPLTRRPPSHRILTMFKIDHESILCNSR